MGNRFSKKELDGGLIINGGKNIAVQILGITMEEPRLEGVFLVSDTRVRGNYIVGRVVRLQISGNILGYFSPSPMKTSNPPLRKLSFKNLTQSYFVKMTRNTK